MDGKYCSYRMRCGKQEFESDKEKQIMEILAGFGESIDPHGYDDGDYDEAMTCLLRVMDLPVRSFAVCNEDVDVELADELWKLVEADMKTLRHSPVDSEYSSVIIADKIVRLSKSEDGEVTYIHLTNGEVIESEDSMNTIEARLNSDS